MLSRIRHHVPVWRRALRKRRRTLIVLLLALVAAMMLPSMLPASRDASMVVVAATDLPPGTEIEQAHLREVRVASALVPAGAADSAQALIGQRSAVGVPAGTAVLPGFLESDSSPGIPPGMALLAVPAPGVLHGHLLPGAAVEILAAGADPGRPLLISAEVVEVVALGSATVPELGGGGADEVAVLVLVERAKAGDVAQAMSEGWLTVSVIG